MITKMHGYLGLAALSVALCALSGCGGDGGSGGSGGTGGTTASGGTTNSGGTTASGGNTSSGGTTASGGTGGATAGKMCGGIAGIQCAADEFCDFLDDQCGGADGAGECKPRPQGCPDIYMPVCACDGEVKGNGCDANAQGQDVNVLGGCTAPAGMMPCGPGFCELATSYCQRTTSDVAGYPDSFSCIPLPAGCGDVPSCACLANENCGNMCSEADGGLTLTCPGG